MDIYGLLLDASKKQRKAKKEQLLKSVGVKKFFDEGSIKIDMRTCKGIECKLCIKECPTSALFWKAGEIGVTEELCIYCTSCVLTCMVDNCIEVERKRTNGETERFSTPIHVCALLERLNAEKRVKTAELVFPDQETYLKRYFKPFFLTEQEKLS
jgi:ferredoxin